MERRPGGTTRGGRYIPELAAIGAIFVATLAVWPVGDYVVDDDWIYTKSLLRLHETGELRILDFNPMTLVAHLGWGLLFTKTFGFGFTVAKLSTVVLLLVECLALAALLRRVGATERTTTLGVLTLVFNPLHFFQSFLYATDVPNLAWSTLALLGYAAGLAASGGTSRCLCVLASCCGALAWGVRQQGIAVVVAVFLYVVLFDRERLRQLGFWLSSFAAPVMAVAVVSWWYYGIHGATIAHVQARGGILLFLSRLAPLNGIWIAYCIAAYVAFFVFPLLVATPLRHYRLERRATSLVALGAAAVLVGIFLWVTPAYQFIFPYLRNKITMFGYLSPNELVVGARDVLWPPGLAPALSGVLLVGVVGFVLRALGGPVRDDGADDVRRTTRRLATTLLCLQLVMVFLTMGIAFDRHLLVLMPTALIVFVGSLPPRTELRWRRAAGCLVPLALYAVAGTHDVHAFSRAAFRAGERLIADGVDARFIDAGYAFDGWHVYERGVQGQDARPGEHRRPDRRPWWIRVVTPGVRSRFVISLSETMETDAWAHGVSPWAGNIAFVPALDGYRTIRSHPYRSYWPFERKRVYVLADETGPPLVPGELAR